MGCGRGSAGDRDLESLDPVAEVVGVELDGDFAGACCTPFELRAAQPEPAAQLVRAELGLDDLIHLPQAEPEILQRDDRVQQAELVCRVGAIPGGVVTTAGRGSPIES